MDPKLLFKNLSLVISVIAQLISHTRTVAGQKNGLGLFDIRESSEGLIIVVRRSRMPETKESERHHHRQNANIHIHTYDWFLERLHGIVRFSGPTGANSYLFHRLDPNDSIEL